MIVVAAGPPINPMQMPEEMLDIDNSMQVTERSEAARELAREGMTPSEVSEKRRNRNRSWVKKVVVGAIIILLLLSLIAGFFQLL